MSNEGYRSGYIALIGRPNVGKSTLLNHILGQKVSITSEKPQTTRHAILGIKTTADAQYVYVDTPGLHVKAKKAMNRYMNRAASSVLHDVDAIVFVVEALQWTEEDQHVIELLADVHTPVILAVNKVDKVKLKEQLLPYLSETASKFAFAQIIPVSATSGKNVPALEKQVGSLLPQGEPLFPEEQVTDRSERFMAAELIREKLMRKLRDELPYALTVEIERFSEEKGLYNIDAIIWVERDSQKAIIIGKGGGMLKEIGRQARIDMERMFEHKVFLQLWVKVKEGWSDNDRVLKTFGYSDGG